MLHIQQKGRSLYALIAMYMDTVTDLISIVFFTTHGQLNAAARNILSWPNEQAQAQIVVFVVCDRSKRPASFSGTFKSQVLRMLS